MQNKMVEIPANELARLLVIACVLITIARCSSDLNATLQKQVAKNSDVCSMQINQTAPSTECLQKRFDECVASEKMSRLECAASTGLNQR